MSKYEPTERAYVACAYGGCRNKAIISRHAKNLSAGWTNLCMEHYDQENLTAALKWNHDHGLDTTEKRKDFIFKNKGGVFKPMQGDVEPF